MPEISVLMGVYYQKKELDLLKRSIQSILSQTMADFELIICDDGSKEEACKCIDAFASRDKRVIVVRGVQSHSLPAKLNACLRIAKSQWIGRMDDDDFSHPNRFSVQMDYLKTHQNVSFVGCNVNVVQDGKVIGQRNFPEFPSVRDFYFVQPFIHPTLILKKEVLDAVNGYSEDKHCILCEDYDLLLRLYANGYQGANVQDILFDYTTFSSANNSRKMTHRVNETVTRFRRFRELKCLPYALPYVIKPMVVGVMPKKVVKWMKGLCQK